MGDTEGKGSFGLSQRTQAIIALGLVVLLAVLLVANSVRGNSSPPPPPAPDPGTPPLGQPAGTNDAALAVLRAEPSSVQLPQPPSTVFITRDPFVATDRLQEALNRLNPSRLGPQSPNGPSPEDIAKAVLNDATALTLKGIFGDDDERVAFVNDQIVRKGGTVGGFSVVEIEERKIVLEKEDQRIELKLADPGASGSPPSRLPSQKGD